MKRIGVIILFSLFGLVVSFGQDTITIIYNKNREVINRYDSMEFYRKLFYKDKLWYAKEFYKNGKIRMIGSYGDKKCIKPHGDFIYYYANGKKDFEGKFEKGKYSGDWNWYFENGQISAKEKYIKNKRINAEFWDSTGIKVDSAKAESFAKFQNGDLQDFSDWVMERVTYPYEAINAGITGKVYIQFTVDVDGSVEDIKLLRGVDKLLNNAAIKAIQGSPKWIPAKQHNRAVKHQFVIPVTFKLTK